MLIKKTRKKVNGIVREKFEDHCIDMSYLVNLFDEPQAVYLRHATLETGTAAALKMGCIQLLMKLSFWSWIWTVRAAAPPSAQDLRTVDSVSLCSDCVACT